MFKVHVSHKNMKQKSKRKPALLQKVTATTIVAVIAVLIAGFAVVPRVTADRFQDQINDLKGQNSNNQNVLSALKVEASSYQDAINKLQAQINQVQAQINENVAKQNDLQVKIDDGQRELDRQRGILGENIRVMYVEGQITTIGRGTRCCTRLGADGVP